MAAGIGIGGAFCHLGDGGKFEIVGSSCPLGSLPGDGGVQTSLQKSFPTFLEWCAVEGGVYSLQHDR